MKDQWTVVTGGTDGIGFAIADRFACAGSNVVVAGREAALAEAAQARLAARGSKVVTVCVDFSERDAVSRLLGEVNRHTDAVHTLVNNVGMIRFTPVAEVTHDEFDTFVSVNIRTAYFMTQGLLPALQRVHGNVINLTSYFAQKNIPGRASTLYSMTKGAIKSLTTAMAQELGPLGVRVNAIAPGTVNSPGRTAEIAKMAPEAQLRLADYNQRSYPIGRIGEPEDVAHMAHFLASDAAAWVTGSTMVVDGGLTTG